MLLLLLLLLRACCCTATTVLGTVDIITGQIQKTCVCYIVSHCQRGTYMCDHTVQLVHVQLIAVAQFTALGTETGQRKCCGHIRADFLHAAGETIQLDDE